MPPLAFLSAEEESCPGHIRYFMPRQLHNSEAFDAVLLELIPVNAFRGPRAAPTGPPDPEPPTGPCPVPWQGPRSERRLIAEPESIFFEVLDESGCIARLLEVGGGIIAARGLVIFNEVLAAALLCMTEDLLFQVAIGTSLLGGFRRMGMDDPTRDLEHLDESYVFIL